MLHAPIAPIPGTCNPVVDFIEATYSRSYGYPGISWLAGKFASSAAGISNEPAEGSAAQIQVALAVDN